MGRSRKKQGAGGAGRGRFQAVLAALLLVVLIAAAVLLASGRLPEGLFKEKSSDLVASASSGRRETAGGAQGGGETLSGQDGQYSGAGQDGYVEPDNSEYRQNFAGSILEKDAVPGINALMEAYFQAESDCDVDALNRLFTSGDTSMAEKQKRDLEFMKKYVEGYGNLACYTVQGPADDFYIAYTYYETKYYLADTWAPGLIHPFVQRQEDGSFKIYDGEMTPELTEFLEQTEVNEDVRLLASEVDGKLAEALSADSELAAMVEFIRQGPNYEKENQGE